MIVINTIRVEHWDGADRTNFAHRYDARRVSLEEIGRASCRERVYRFV